MIKVAAMMSATHKN